MMSKSFIYVQKTHDLKKSAEQKYSRALIFADFQKNSEMNS